MNPLFKKIYIIYEDENVVVIDKPSSLVVTPGPGHDEGVTIVGWLIERYGEAIREACVEGHRPGIVHRLDKATSGVMICAKNIETLHYLIDQFKSRTVEKQYEALVWGDITQHPLLRRTQSDSFTIDAPIGRNPKNRMRMAIVEDGKPAITEIQCKYTETIGEEIISRVVCTPRSGRTHQIRVHLASMGYGIVGDMLYQSSGKEKKYKLLVRQ